MYRLETSVETHLFSTTQLSSHKLKFIITILVGDQQRRFVVSACTRDTSLPYRSGTLW